MNNVRQKCLSVSDYTIKVKDLSDSLGATNVNIDNDEMVQIFLADLSHKFCMFWTAITTRENSPTFIDLESMLRVEENHLQSKSTMSDGQMLYTQGHSGRGRNRGNMGRNGRGSARSAQYPQRVMGSNDDAHQPSTSHRN